MSIDTHSNFKKLSPQELKHDSITPSTATMLGKVRGRSIKILILLEKQSSRTVELSESLDYPPHYVWRYLKNLQNYGLVREQEYIWFLTDKGASFVIPFLKNYVLTIKSRNEIQRTRKNLETKSQLVLKQISLEEYCQIHNLNDCAKVVVEVLMANWRATGKPGRVFRDYYEATDWFNEKSLGKSRRLLTQAELGDVLIVLNNEGTCWHPMLKVSGRPKIGLKKEFIQKLKLEPRD